MDITSKSGIDGMHCAIIAVCNRKGGAGKSTTSVNLATGLADAGKRVLLIDLDTQGHCAVGLGAGPPQAGRDAHVLFSAPGTSLLQLAVDTSVAGLKLVRAEQGFEHGSGLRDDGIFARALEDPALRAAFDVIIIDTPPSLDMLLMNALVAATWVLVPYLPHPLSFEGIRQLMRVLFKVISKRNPGLKIMGFVPVMENSQVKQHRATSTQVGKQFGAGRVLPGIRNDIRVAEAFAAGQPIARYAPACRGAQDFRALTAAIGSLLGLELETRAMPLEHGT